MNTTLNPDFLKFVVNLSSFEPPYKFGRFTRNSPSNKEYNDLLNEYCAVCRKLELLGRLLLTKEEQLVDLNNTLTQLNKYIDELEYEQDKTNQYCDDELNWAEHRNSTRGDLFD